MSGVCEDATPVLDNFLPASGHSLLRGISPNERWKILRQISMPVEKGPENRYDFASFQERDSPSFIKFNPFSKEENYPLAPLRDDVPIIDPCSGHLSAGAEADLMIDGRSNFIQNGCDPTRPNAVVDMSERPQTPPIRPSALTADLSSDKRWNSRAVSEAAVRARLGGWTSPTRVRPASPKLPNILSNKTVFFNVDDATQVSNSRPSVQLRDMAAKRYCYTSSTQRSYEEVDWDTKLPPRFKPPASTLEKMADPVSQRFTLKRYDSGPEPWQAVGGLWDRFQIRTPNKIQKPISYGTAGAENMEDVDNPEEEFVPFTVQRTLLPQYTETAHRPNIPGYTGRVHFKASHPANSSLPTPPTTALVHGYIMTSGNKSPHRRLGPLSKMVTNVSPCNPFQNIRREAVHV
ncbi:protein SPMIP7 isoform X2 [Lepisosteus oculatus]|uniref:protein SPMIP7 isoform X2 n=1 Tax=Lepisosteus oculatus TaxID=7918 RepID=UPI00073FF204|nr:PREDICTED: uncharacterized protein C7orf72 homolog isoform X2 [Lepisosteus oculatus]